MVVFENVFLLNSSSSLSIVRVGSEPKNFYFALAVGLFLSGQCCVGKAVLVCVFIDLSCAEKKEKHALVVL